MAKLDEGRPQFTYVSPDHLRFDPTNPRFGSAGGGKGQDEIQKFLEEPPHYALQIVDSFLANGFIDYEPLVVRRDGDHFIVVEGNRRLAAVRHILKNRAEYVQKSTKIDDLLEIPVLVFPEATGPQEEEQRVYLGVKHLFGFRDWPAESKARFLDSHIRSKEDLARTMRELNIKKAEISRYVVPYRLRKAAGKLWEPYRTQEFWVLGEGLNRSGVKEYVELKVDNDSLQVREFNRDKLKAVLQFIYGTPEGGRLVNKKVPETRELSTLSKVLAVKRAAAVLEKGGSLDEAKLFIETPQESLNSLKRLVNELKLLLKGVLARNRRQQESKTLLKRFAAFEESVREFIRDAKKPGI
jgi:hypothetical protein